MQEKLNIAVLWQAVTQSIQCKLFAVTVVNRMVSVTQECSRQLTNMFYVSARTLMLAFSQMPFNPDLSNSTWHTHVPTSFGDCDPSQGHRKVMKSIYFPIWNVKVDLSICSLRYFGSFSPGIGCKTYSIDSQLNCMLWITDSQLKCMLLMILLSSLWMRT